MLIKKSSFLNRVQTSTAWGAEELGNKFADPLPDDEVTEYRDIFGLGGGNGKDALSAVAVFAKE